MDNETLIYSNVGRINLEQDIFRVKHEFKLNIWGMYSMYSSKFLDTEPISSVVIDLVDTVDLLSDLDSLHCGKVLIKINEQMALYFKLLGSFERNYYSFDEPLDIDMYRFEMLDFGDALQRCVNGLNKDLEPVIAENLKFQDTLDKAAFEHID